MLGARSWVLGAECWEVASEVTRQGHALAPALAPSAVGEADLNALSLAQAREA